MHLIGMSAYAHFSFLQARTKLSQKIFPYYHQHHLSHITTRIPIGSHLTFTFCHLFQISWHRVLSATSPSEAFHMHICRWWQFLDWPQITLSLFILGSDHFHFLPLFLHMVASPAEAFGLAACRWCWLAP